MKAGTLDVAFIGGGLANSLAAFRLAQRHPALKNMIFEREGTLGGHHTWSFQSSDLPASGSWIKDLVSCSWDAYQVYFPSYERQLLSAYNAIRSRDFDRKLRFVLAPGVRFGAEVVEFGRDFVRLATGERYLAKLVIDGRGFAAEAVGANFLRTCAYQKFFGLFVRCAKAHGLRTPVIMDARVEQKDGYRFIYILPWSAHDLLLEDTRYSDNPYLDTDIMRQDILTYARAQNYSSATAPLAVLDEERGVLPIPLASTSAPVWQEDVVSSGAAAGLFHPTTGYSLPEAVVFADLLAGLDPLTLNSESLRDKLRRHAEETWRRGRFFRRLNNVFFYAVRPDERRLVMEQFYGRGEALIGRFYRGRLSCGDSLRILSGKPPVPVRQGLNAFFGRSVFG